MQLLDKKEKDMTKEELIKLKFMRTMAVIIRGINLKHPVDYYNLTHRSQLSRYYELFKKIYKVDEESFLRDKDALKDHFPDNELLYPGKLGYEEAISKLRFTPEALNHDAMIKSRLLDTMSYSEKQVKEMNKSTKKAKKDEADPKLKTQEDLAAEAAQNAQAATAPAAQSEDEQIANSVENSLNQIPDAEDEVIPEMVDHNELEGGDEDDTIEQEQPKSATKKSTKRKATKKAAKTGKGK